MTVSSSRQITTFHLYNLLPGYKFGAIAGAKKVEFQGLDPELRSLALSERFIVYLSPGQFNELPETYKANELFVDFLRVCSLSIRPEILPEDISSQERERHIYDTQSAVALLHKTANRGFARAQFLLGQCYWIGADVRQSFEKAATLFKKSAEQDYLRALMSYGFCCEQGKGILQNIGEAIEFYRKAADQQYLPAQVALARAEEKLKAQRTAVHLPLTMSPETVTRNFPKEEKLLKDQAKSYEEKIRIMKISHEKTLQTLRDIHRKEINKLEEIIAVHNRQVHELKHQLAKQIADDPD